MTTVTFRVFYADGIEEMTVELAAPVHLTRLQHKIAPGGLSEFEPTPRPFAVTRLCPGPPNAGANRSFLARI